MTGGKVIDWGMCKTFKFVHTVRWYMHKPEFVLDNQAHKVLWDFGIQTDPRILARRPDLLIVKKRPCRTFDFAMSADHRIKIKENEKIDKYLDLARELKMLRNMKL